MEEKEVKVLHDYEGSEKGYFVIRKDEILKVYQTKDGWHLGCNDKNEYGWFPTTYVEEHMSKNNERTESLNENTSSWGDDFPDEEVIIPQMMRKTNLRDTNYPVNFNLFKSEIPCSLPKFTGAKHSIKVYEWISLYENDDCHLEQERVKKLMKHLEGEEALTWYAQEVVSRIMGWDECKKLMLNRFGGSHNLRPIVAAFHRKFDSNDNIRSYFTEKMALLNQTNLEDADKVAILTDGMPKHYQPSLSPYQIGNPSQWQKFASHLEEVFKIKMPGHCAQFPFSIDDDSYFDKTMMISKEAPPKYTSK